MEPKQRQHVLTCGNACDAFIVNRKRHTYVVNAARNEETGRVT